MAKKAGKKGSRNRQSSPAKVKKAERKPGRDPNAPRRAELIEAANLARKRKARLTRLGIYGLVAALVAGVLAWQIVTRRNAQRTITTMTAASCTYDTKSDPGRVNEHSSGAAFRVNPPAGGVHPATPASAGIYTEDNLPGDGPVVHALEHGLIAIFYRPDVADEDLASLTKLARDYRNDLVLLPRSTLGGEVAATAWHRRLLCDEFELANLREFVAAYVGKGPERVPRN